MIRMKKKKTMIVTIVTIIAVLVIIGRYFHLKASPFSDESTIECNELVMGADGGGLYYMNVNKTGIFFIDNGIMKYSDYESGDEYVLCDRANCMHSSSDCGAYAYGMRSVAAYDGYMYAFVDNRDKNTWDLIRMSMNGKDRKCISSIDKGSCEAEQWYLDNFVQSVYYGYGKAYVPVEYYYVYPEDYRIAEKSVVHTNGLMRKQLLMIDLSNGEQTVLAEVEGMDLFHDAEFQLISEDQIIMSIKEAPGALLGRELEDAIMDGKMDWLDEAWKELPESEQKEYWGKEKYDFYVDYEVYMTKKQTMSMLMYDCASGETSTLFQTNCGYWYDKDGNLNGWNTPYKCMGWYENGFILLVEDDKREDQPSHVLMEYWNFDTQKLEPVFEIEDGGIPMMSFGTVGNYVLDDGKIMYIEYLEDGESAQTFYFDIKEKRSVPLFQDVRNITFRFLGETEDSFVGDMLVGNDHSAYIIRKQDYYSGNFKAAIKLIADPGKGV